MRSDLIILALLVGFGTYLFRFAPTQLHIGTGSAGNLIDRILSAVGTAAITTLLVAGLMPEFSQSSISHLPPMAGCLGVVTIFLATRHIAISTIGGAVVYGFTFAIVN